ncbi:MAG: hypothetical protein NDI61_09880 [Bdellovibrionaceae bacterium]|nr:hypothetical protein [Pseudobdellovibrionaceae bacterium]
MENLNPALRCLIEMQSALQNGETVRAGLLRYTQSASDDFASQVRRFLFDWEQGRDWRPAVQSIASANRRALLELAACALSGQAIHTHLCELRMEIQAACESEIKEHIDMLPLRMLFPLLLLLFPSYLVLLFGPVLAQFVRELTR